MSSPHNDRLPDQTDDRDVSLDLLAAEFADRLRNGTPASVESYIDENPELADSIPDLFSVVATVEQLRERRAFMSGGPMAGISIPEQLGDARIVREVGRGGMGIVFEAEQEALGRRVAVKVLPRAALWDVKSIQRFRRESATAARLHHSNIVSIFSVGQHEGCHYYVMQFIEGDNLARVIERLRSGLDDSVLPAYGSPPYWKQVAILVQQLAAALDYAHQLGTLHRDIKPSNLLLDGSGHVWIADFGLARTFADHSASMTHSVAGTLSYMSPEQQRGEVDERSDIYSLGLVLFELLTLQAPFQVRQLSDPHRHVPAPRFIRADIPRDLETITLKAADPLSDRRYRSAADFAADLDRFINDLPILARRIGPLERLGRWARKNPLVAGLSGLSMLLLTAVAVVLAISNLRIREAFKQSEASAQSESVQRLRAERGADVAWQSLERILEQTSREGALLREASQNSPRTSGVEFSLPLSQDTVHLLNELLAAYQNFADQDASSSSNERIMMAQHRIGSIQYDLGLLSPSKATLESALERCEQWGRTSKTPSEISESRLWQAKILNDLGNVSRDCLDFEAAASAHRRAAEVSENLLATSQPDAAEPLLLQANMELGRAMYCLGRYIKSRIANGAPDGERLAGDRQASFDSLAKALEAFAACLKISADSTEAEMLSALCHFEQSTLIRVHRPPLARELALAAIETLQRLVQEHPDNASMRYALSVTLALGAARPTGMFNNENRSESRLTDALQHANILVRQHPKNPAFQFHCAELYQKQGAIFIRQERFEQANDSLASAYSISKDLCDAYPEQALFQLRHAFIGQTWARHLVDRHTAAESPENLQTAKKLLLSSKEILDGLLASQPNIETRLTQINQLLEELEKALRDSTRANASKV